MDQGRSGGIGISRAKRLLKELQSQAVAAQLAQRLHALLQERPCGSASLKVRLLPAGFRSVLDDLAECLCAVKYPKQFFV